MSARKPYQVIANLYGGWSIARIGAKRALKRFPSRADAIDRGRQISLKGGVDLFVHRNDGTVERKVSFQDDLKDQAKNL